MVGAPLEASAARGIDGNQLDNSAIASGAAYVFERSGGTWVQSAYLKPLNTDPVDQFGRSVSISGNTIAIGAEGESSQATGINGRMLDNQAPLAGAVYVYVRNGNTWAQQAYLKASNTDARDGFGFCLELSGNTLVVGAPNEDSQASGVDADQDDDPSSQYQSGAAYVFERSGTTWTQQAYLKASNAGAGDEFGHCVAISGDTIVVAASKEDSGATGVNGDQDDNSQIDSGAAYVFERSGSSWSQSAYLKASNTDGSPVTFAADSFGSSLAISGDTIVVGALLEASASTGVDGDQEDDSLPAAGAAYVFVRDPGGWAQEAYLKASNTLGSGLFGTSLAIEGDRLFVGAVGEQSLSAGVNGNQASALEPQVGAVYQFERSQGAWQQTGYLKPSHPGRFDVFGNALALSGDTLIVGSLGEDTTRSGINASPNEGGLGFDAGAIFAFDLAPDAGTYRYGTYTGNNSADLHSFSVPVPLGTIDLELSDFPSSGRALLFLATGPANLPFSSGSILIDPGSLIFSALPIPLSGGSGQYSAQIPSAAAGMCFFAQAAYLVPGQPGAAVLTNGLRIEVLP